VPLLLTRMDVLGRDKPARTEDELVLEQFAVRVRSRPAENHSLACRRVLDHLVRSGHAAICSLIQSVGAPLTIAIAGAGVAGSYIYRLLNLRGHRHVEIFDIRHRIACGIHPCGYGVDGSFNTLTRLAGLDPARYVLHIPPRLLARVESVAVRTSVFMIDKPRLVHDLLDGAAVRYDPVDVDRYDLVIDATGAARAYAPPLPNDLKARVVQWRLRVRRPMGTTFMPTRRLPGYAWIMPLDGEGFDLHVGAGCRAGAAVLARDLTQPAFRLLDIERTVCACGGHIRLSGPDFARVVHENVWAVGEAAGLVGAASGAGNVYAMRSGLLLVEHLSDAAAYVEALQKDFTQLVPEAAAVRKIVLGKLPTVRDLLHIRRGWDRAGVHVAWHNLPRVVFAMGRAFVEGR
jgi:flavin-dependent dehydrogenase